MNIFSRTHSFITATFVFAGLAVTTAHAQSIFVNGAAAPCPTATVMFGAGTISINTVGCTGTVASPPSISSVSPSSGQPRTPIVINGANMSGATVTVGGLAAGVTGNTGTVITTSVPSTATAASVGGIVVTVPGLAPATFAFTVQDPPQQAAPIITSVSPSSGTAGTIVTIAGTSLTGATVRIGGLSTTVTSNNGTTITTSVPGTATAASVGGVVVTVGAFPPATAAFTVLALPAPSIIAVTPASGSAGTPVTITGTGLSGATVTIGGVAAAITAGSATSISTSVPASAAAGQTTIVVTNSTSSAPSAFTVSPPETAACADMSVDGFPLGCVSKRPPSVQAVPPKHSGANGAGEEINAYSMNVARCKTTPALTKSWQHNIDMTEYKKNEADFFLLNANESLSYKFKTRLEPTAGGFSYNEAAQSGGNTAPIFITITADPCDFDVSKVAPGPSQDFCYQSGVSGMAIGWTNTSGLPRSYCRLNPDQTYYMNVRFQDARPASEGGSPTQDSCFRGPCGGILTIR